MPINDSAGVGVYLIDKSQRSAVAIGFRSAGAIESDRGLCNTPTLISSEDDFVKTFGTPSMERHGLAAMEAYLLAQRKVPQVLVRAKDPTMLPSDTPFGAMKFTVEKKGGRNELVVKEMFPASAIASPVESNEAILYFKGEGAYCSKDSKNVVVRMSEPLTQSAYAKEGRSVRVQLFDFNGANHIDEDVTAELAFNPDISNLISATGDFKLDGFLVGTAAGSDAGSAGGHPVNVTAFVNGCVYRMQEFDYSALSDWGMFNKFADAIKGATYADGEHVIKPSKEEAAETEHPDDYWDVSMLYGSGETSVGSGSDADDTYGVYYLYSGKDGGPQELNCFGLSISLTVTADLPIAKDPNVGREVTPGFYSFPCGSVTVVKNTDREGYTAKFNISTNLYLKNRNTYMFMGEQNEYWASYYRAYCVNDYVVSMSYDDFDANYVSMQMDAVMGGSKYLVPKSSEVFGDYTIKYTKDDLTTKLHYFEGTIKANDIPMQNKSYAYSQALQVLLGDNLTRWRCLATPNLGDVMNPADYLSAITAADESTLGISNIGRAAAFDVFANLTGRHGNRFIADYCQYAYRTLAGKRTAVTMACLVADLLNSHYNDGIEARPPFGYNYGQIHCLELSQQFSGPERNMLARQFKINPVIEDGGYFIWEERTSQLTDTSLSDEHCIISFIWMKFAIYDAMKAFVAEYNDQSTVKRGLAVLNQLNQNFIDRNYIEEGIVSADKNVIGDEVLRFDYAVRFKGVARFVDVYITAYSQTQTLAVSLAQEA
jgi:hypothetical protein